MSKFTVKDLYEHLAKIMQEKNGAHKDKVIFISNDEEGNGYHGLYYGVCTVESEIRDVIEMGMLDEQAEAEDIVLLG